MALRVCKKTVTAVQLPARLILQSDINHIAILGIGEIAVTVTHELCANHFVAVEKVTLKIAFTIVVEFVDFYHTVVGISCSSGGSSLSIVCNPLSLKIDHRGCGIVFVAARCNNHSHEDYDENTK